MDSEDPEAKRRRRDDECGICYDPTDKLAPCCPQRVHPKCFGQCMRLSRLCPFCRQPPPRASPEKQFALALIQVEIHQRNPEKYPPNPGCLKLCETRMAHMAAGCVNCVSPAKTRSFLLHLLLPETSPNISELASTAIHAALARLTAFLP